MVYQTTMETYEALKACLHDLRPEIEVKLISSDPMLKELGFVEKIPCVVEVCATEEEIEDIRCEAIDYEVNAFNFEYKEDDPGYKDYIKYTWLFDFLRIKK